jgi:hypothetical protein
MPITTERNMSVAWPIVLVLAAVSAFATSLIGAVRIYRELMSDLES